MRFLLLSALLASCTGFGASPQLPRSAVALRRSAPLMAEAPVKEEEATEAAAEEAAPPAVEYSESLPFLVKRPQLKGYVGDVGFDPLGFSEILPMVRCAPRSRPHQAAASPCAPRATAPAPIPCRRWRRHAADSCHSGLAARGGAQALPCRDAGLRTPRPSPCAMRAVRSWLEGSTRARSWAGGGGGGARRFATTTGWTALAASPGLNGASRVAGTEPCRCSRAHRLASSSPTSTRCRATSSPRSRRTTPASPTAR